MNAFMCLVFIITREGAPKFAEHPQGERTAGVCAPPVHVQSVAQFV